MKRFLSFALRHHPILSGIFAVALAGCTVFVWDFAADAIYFGDPRNQDRPLELWMSPRYVGQSWDIPREMIFEIMQIDEQGGPENFPRTLSEVLQRTGLTLDELQALVAEAATNRPERGNP